jgi:hypothetical protein
LSRACADAADSTDSADSTDADGLQFGVQFADNWLASVRRPKRRVWLSGVLRRHVHGGPVVLVPADAADAADATDAHAAIFVWLRMPASGVAEDAGDLCVSSVAAKQRLPRLSVQGLCGEARR